MPFWKSLKESGGRGGLLWLALAAAVGIALLLIGGEAKEEKQTESTSPSRSVEEELELYRKELEESIIDICNSVAGVSDVSVAVSLACGFESVYATEQGANGEVYVVIGSGSSASALLLSYATPRLSGIGIVCQGGNDPTVQQRLTALLSAAFDLSSNRIYVTGK